MKRRQKLLFSI